MTTLNYVPVTRLFFQSSNLELARYYFFIRLLSKAFWIPLNASLELGMMARL